MQSPEYMVVMKVGFHAGEGWDTILERKMAEERNTGRTYWGYGGSVCHPTRQVQPFAALAEGPVSVLMVPTPSPFYGTPAAAEEWSTDGTDWASVAPGVRITGSKWALVLSDVAAVDDTVDLGSYRVGVGAKAGTPLPSYLRSRVDKACAVRAEDSADSQLAPVVMTAKLAEPFAVFLR